MAIQIMTIFQLCLKEQTSFLKNCCNKRKQFATIS